MLTHRLRILASLLVAFFVVNLYGRMSTGPFISPIQADNVKGLLSNLKFKSSNILDSLNPLNSLNLTKLFTLKFNSDNNGADSSSNLPNTNPQPINQTPTSSWQLVPTNQVPSGTWPTPTNQVPTGTWKPTPTLKPGVPTKPKTKPSPTKKPLPTPTKYIKPTKPPKPTSIPPITTDLRPGTSLKEIFQEVNKRACIPTALLMAFKTLETGERFKNDSATTIKTYNTYGWWITGAGDPCYGYGYYTQSGIVPPDSVSAGMSCNSPIGSPNDLKIMGLTQISEWEQEVAQKYVASTLPKNDRRVFFDNALIFAYITRSRVGDPPKDCNNWPDDAVRTAAEKHSGTCQYYYSQNGASGDYCKQILDLYKQYKKGGL